MKQTEIIKLFSKNMKNERVALGITQEELSFRSGLHRNYISDTERGTRNISLEAIEKIAKGLDIEIADLFKVNNNPERKVIWNEGNNE